MEGFNAGNPPLGFGGYPGSEFPGSCGGGAGNGGYGHYGTYGGCPTQDHYDGSYSEYDSMDAEHAPGCACQACQTPYSVAYAASAKACGCVGDCGCGEGVVSAGHSGSAGPHELASVSADVAGQNLVDVGLTNGTGLTAYAQVPFLGVSVNLYQLFRYAVLLCIIAAFAYFLFGFKVKSLF